MSEDLKTRPRFDIIFPGQNKSLIELVSHPENTEHLEYLIDQRLQITHGPNRCGIHLSPIDDSVEVKGKLVSGGMELRGILAPDSHLLLTNITDPEISPLPNEQPPFQLKGRFTLVIRND